jgi:hypothetical protein
MNSSEITMLQNLTEEYLLATKKLVQNKENFHKLDFNIEINQMKNVITSYFSILILFKILYSNIRQYDRHD